MTFLRKLCLIIASNQFKIKSDSDDLDKDISDEKLVKKIAIKKDSMMFGVL
ncbi:hypothetical protein [Maribacter antarcticus]|uniref:hypothetical protein n=1 Tax=Maribacter antarcticus TaxID=505250 RepID=UPI000A92627F|nr:hypothetical protein [Maribacter antarcticus]